MSSKTLVSCILFSLFQAVLLFGLFILFVFGMYNTMYWLLLFFAIFWAVILITLIILALLRLYEEID